MEHKPVYYGEYLQLDKILGAQEPVSFSKPYEPAHDEMLFIVIHQAYELWFKQILFEVDSVISILSKPTINDNSPELQRVVHRLQRVNTIMKVLVQQVDILETMTPMDFLEFRDLLRPASGFQSWQFKVLEARLGLKFGHRYGQHYYTSQLKPHDIETIHNVEKQPTLLEQLNKWLERMPFFERKYWESYKSVTISPAFHPFWDNYFSVYEQSLSAEEKNNAAFFREMFFKDDASQERSLSSTACRAALFIMSYRGYPMLELPFKLLDTLIETDNQLGNWRYRHINMVKRMIGSRVGTGGSTGAGYLQGAMEKHHIYKELSQLNSFLMERNRLPELPGELIKQLGYRD